MVVVDVNGDGEPDVVTANTSQILYQLFSIVQMIEPTSSRTGRAGLGGIYSTDYGKKLEKVSKKKLGLSILIIGFVIAEVMVCGYGANTQESTVTSTRGATSVKRFLETTPTGRFLDLVNRSIEQFALRLHACQRIGWLDGISSSKVTGLFSNLLIVVISQSV